MGYKVAVVGTDDPERPVGYAMAYRPVRGYDLLDRVIEHIPMDPDRLLSKPTYVDRAIADVVGALDDGNDPELSAENALQTTEVIFACWESARRGGRVELPLEIDDNPLEAMIEAEEPVVNL